MSPKDLKTIHFLNKMLDAGVSVLKIEGRARGAEYVKTVVECYKEAVEAYLAGEYSQDTIDDKIRDWDERLSKVFNRGFWDGYYQGQRLGEWTRHYGSAATRKKVYAGKCTNFFSKISVAEFLVEAHEVLSTDELLITGETTGAYLCDASQMRVYDSKGREIEGLKKADKGMLICLKTTEQLRRGDKLFIYEKQQ